MKNLIIIGNGVHSKVVEELALLLKYRVVGFIDIYNENPNCLGYLNDLGTLQSNNPDYYYVIATGNNQIRKFIADKCPSLNYVTLISPNAYISHSARIGCGTVILHKVIVNTNAIIGSHCLVNNGAIVEHDSIIGDYCHLSPGVALGGAVKIGSLTHLGLNSSVRNNLTVVSNVIIGMGAAVTKNITEAGTYIGVPAKKI